MLYKLSLNMLRALIRQSYGFCEFAFVWMRTSSKLEPTPTGMGRSRRRCLLVDGLYLSLPSQLTQSILRSTRAFLKYLRAKLSSCPARFPLPLCRHALFLPLLYLLSLFGSMQSWTLDSYEQPNPSLIHLAGRSGGRLASAEGQLIALATTRSVDHPDRQDCELGCSSHFHGRSVYGSRFSIVLPFFQPGAFVFVVHNASAVEIFLPKL